ncbi:lipopolysaccharide transport periplasmic protein LptA [Candidatus Halobeggiatoa sp. HSG11]|nr:lipopolysaccharide transport periplasmic protein LptA [Candidatus Halobeggiatoa sp. HSG11]
MYFNRILLIALMLVYTNIYALSDDRDQPILIEANQAAIDNIKGIATYEGNVVVTQGSIRIDADKITLNYTPEQAIEKIIATGDLASFTQHLDNKENIKAKAKHMEYNAVKDTLHLTDKAELRKQKDGKDIYTSNAPRILYDTKKGFTKADGGDDNNGRIKISIEPQHIKKK